MSINQRFQTAIVRLTFRAVHELQALITHEAGLHLTQALDMAMQQLTHLDVAMIRSSAARVVS